MCWVYVGSVQAYMQLLSQLLLLRAACMLEVCLHTFCTLALYTCNTCKMNVHMHSTWMPSTCSLVFGRLGSAFKLWPLNYGLKFQFKQCEYQCNLRSRPQLTSPFITHPSDPYHQRSASSSSIIIIKINNTNKTSSSPYSFQFIYLFIYCFTHFISIFYLITHILSISHISYYPLSLFDKVVEVDSN